MGSLRFRRTERLLTPAQFKRVYAERDLAKTPCFWIYRAINGLTYSRLGISVKNKTCQHLVARNRLKRILREIFRLHKAEMGPGKDIVIVVKAYPKKPGFDTVSQQVARLMKE